MWLGMQLPEDAPLLWIAREGLMAPLPSNWKRCIHKDDGIFFYNQSSEVSVRQIGVAISFPGKVYGLDCGAVGVAGGEGGGGGQWLELWEL